MFDQFPSLISPICLTNRRAGLRYKKRVESAGIPERFQQWLLDQHVGPQFFALLNVVDAHEPFVNATHDPPVEYVDNLHSWTPRYYAQSNLRPRSEFPIRELESAYLRSLEDADKKLGSVMDSLENSPFSDSTWIVVSSDHGQQFGECGLLYHGIGVTNAVCRIPLVVVPPSLGHRAERCQRWLSLIEMPGLVLEMLLSDEHELALGRITSGEVSATEGKQHVYARALRRPTTTPSLDGFLQVKSGIVGSLPLLDPMASMFGTSTMNGCPSGPRGKIRTYNPR